MRKLIFTLLLSLCAIVASAEPNISYIKVEVTPDHTDWLYKCGEKPQFAVSVRTCSNAPVKNAEIYYEVSEDMLPPIAKGNLTLKDGTTTIKGYTMKKPGFLRCRVWATVDGVKYDECATAGFDIDKITPTTKMPADFKEFWAQSLKINDNIEMLPQITLVPERCTSKVDVYLAKFQNYRVGSYIYGTLCVPKKHNGKCPAILIVPGAGCRYREGYMEEAEQGVVTLEIGIHGIPTTLYDQPDLYRELRYGGLLNYWMLGIDDKDNYYYRRAYIGCARAVDFLAQLDFVDEEKIAVTGWSQGGALTIVTSYLNPRVKYAAAIYPAMCDLTGRIYDQGDAWPRMFRNKTNITPARIETASYYDVVNFVKGLNIPIFFTYGYNDLTVCPTSMQAAYNVTTAPKELLVVPQSRHFTYPEQRKARSQWLLDKLLK
jgi:cephalosporin-C deacetylase-like acetyl esterase